MKEPWQWTRPASTMLLVTGTFMAGVLCIDTVNGFRAIAAIVGGLCIATLFVPRQVGWFVTAALGIIMVAAFTPFASMISPSGDDLASRLLMLVLPALPGAVLAAILPPKDKTPAFVDDHCRCQFCGYSLEGLRTDRCPECGKFSPPARAIPHALHRPKSLGFVALGCQLWGAIFSVLLLLDGPSNSIFFPALIYFLSCVATMWFRGVAAIITVVFSLAGLVAGTLVGALSGLAFGMLVCGPPGLGSLITIELDRLCSNGKSECPLCRRGLRGPSFESPRSSPPGLAVTTNRVESDVPPAR